MPAARWSDFAFGALTFGGVHAIEVMRWTAWFGGVHEPWFLNSGSATVFTLVCVAAASGIVALSSASVPSVRGITFGAGACAAMTAVLIMKQGGPGTIFPIVMAVGGLFILMSSALGAWIGREARRAVWGR